VADRATRPARSGPASEFTRAAAFLSELATALGLPRSRVALVPGDRDVSLAACHQYFLACEMNETEPVPPYSQKWSPFRRMLREFFGDSLANGSFLVGQEWSLFAVEDLKVVVAGLNSTMAMSHLTTDRRGLVGAAQLAWFADQHRGTAVAAMPGSRFGHGRRSTLPVASRALRW
jgi:hypothetical protein